MDEVLALLDSVRAKAGSLTAEASVPTLDKEPAGVVAEYLERSILQFTERIAAMKDIIARTERIHRQVAEEIDTVATKRHAFFNALRQLDEYHAEDVAEKIHEIEEAQARNGSGEFGGLSVWKAAKIVLQKTGREMTTREIVEALRDGGKELGPKATSAVSAALRTGKAADVFKPVKISGSRQRWALKEPEEKTGLSEEGE
jgi:DNA-binding ferritin-like protein